MMNLTIREATEADIPELALLFDQYRQFYEQPADEALALRFIRERFSRQESVLLVARSPTAGLLGFCQLYPSFCSVEAQPIYVLYDLFVQPTARKAGVGRMLLTAAQARAITDGKARMDLTTARTNKTAQSLYESLGWIRDDIFLTYNRHLPPTPSPTSPMPR
jgi:ribosomal protein S18 acetylase RimI-like enzyme